MYDSCVCIKDIKKLLNENFMSETYIIYVINKNIVDDFKNLYIYITLKIIYNYLLYYYHIKNN